MNKHVGNGIELKVKNVMCECSADGSFYLKDDELMKLDNNAFNE